MFYFIRQYIFFIDLFECSIMIAERILLDIKATAKY